jgi:NAD+ diphosphatase
MSAPPSRSHPTLQRHAEERLREDWIDAARNDPNTGYLLARGTSHLVRRAPHTQIVLLDGEYEGAWTVDPARMTLLGWFEGRRCVLVDLPPEESFSPPPGTEFEELRPLLPLLSSAQAQLLSYARALLVWRSRHRHCGVCGAPTTPRNAGHVLACTSSVCGAEFFPRLDPAIIVLVTHGTQALLGRQAAWPPGRYSALAGFVEPAESLEDTVAREVLEETGVRVDAVRYYGSQPWPFPSSLMLGFHAHAPLTPVHLGDGELEDARWFELEALKNGAAATLPPPYTIARALLESWFANPAAPGGPAGS